MMSTRVPVLKTYKLFIGGQFPRTESGRYYLIHDAKGNALANMCRSSRKDFKEAVVQARKAQHDWAKRSAYNRSQILYRMAEMMEGRKEQFIDELLQMGFNRKKAEQETFDSIDRLIYYAGWVDKFQQVFSTVNPVASAHFNFSVPEATGVVAAIAPENSPLLGLVSVIAPVIAGGNTIIVLASEQKSLSAVTLAEVFHSSDLPGGVVNILTGYRDELVAQFASHMDVNAVWYAAEDQQYKKKVQEEAALNLKRVSFKTFKNWSEADTEHPYLLMDFQEIKTTWHPIGF